MFKLFINNEWHKSSTGKVFPTVDPATGKVTADIQQSGKQDVDLAVSAARSAFR